LNYKLSTYVYVFTLFLLFSLGGQDPEHFNPNADLFRDDICPDDSPGAICQKQDPENRFQISGDRTGRTPQKGTITDLGSTKQEDTDARTCSVLN